MDVLRSIEVMANGCHLWMRATSTQGYGRVVVGGRQHQAHRVVYELLVGPIPDGHDLDHTCHNEDESCPDGPACLHRRCCNVEHLEPTTRQVNLLRGHGHAARNAVKTECPHGHPYDETNTYWYRGKRQCQTCRRERVAVQNAKRRGGQ